jgi:FkbM family methyltransferase
MRTVVEVGANFGNDTEHLSGGNSGNVRVYAIEPTPELVTHLEDRFAMNDNVTVHPVAIDLEEGKAQFNIAGTRDWGCSSLYEFTEDIHEKWEDRPDFAFTDHVIIDKVRLDTFMADNSIEWIDYLWIDAQGNDFRVLKSLGDRIEHVSEGKCEGAYTVDLYSNTDNHVDDIKAWLEERGFACTIVPDNVGKEADVHFKKP